MNKTLLFSLAAIALVACTNMEADPTYNGPLWGDPCHPEPSTPDSPGHWTVVACLHQDDGAGSVDFEHSVTLGLCAPASQAQMDEFPGWALERELHGVCRPFCQRSGEYGSEVYTCEVGTPHPLHPGGWCYCEP